MAEKLLSTGDVAKRCGCEVQTVSRWAAKNDVSYMGESNRKTYIFTEADYKRFLKRPKPGKRSKTQE